MPFEPQRTALFIIVLLAACGSSSQSQGSASDPLRSGDLYITGRLGLDASAVQNGSAVHATVT